MLVAACAYAMHGLAALNFRLQDVSKNATGNFAKLIPLLLAIPCFELHNLCFKVVYSFQVRRLRLLSGNQRSLGVENGALERYLCIVERNSPCGSVQALRNIQRGLQAAHCAADLSNPNHKQSPAIASI